MHSLWIRTSTIFFFSLACLALLCTFATYSVVLLPAPSPEVTAIDVATVKRFIVSRDVDKALFELDIEYDLSTVFNWNVRQLFVYLIAVYKSTHNEVNQVVIYDEIIQEPSKAKVSLQKQFNKYPLVDDGQDLRNKDVEFYLQYEIMPYFGSLNRIEKGSSSFKMPTEYV